MTTGRERWNGVGVGHQLGTESRGGRGASEHGGCWFGVEVVYRGHFEGAGSEPEGAVLYSF